jgi:hypothetical protein
MWQRQYSAGTRCCHLSGNTSGGTSGLKGGYTLDLGPLHSKDGNASVPRPSQVWASGPNSPADL